MQVILEQKIAKTFKNDVHGWSLRESWIFKFKMEKVDGLYTFRIIYFVITMAIFIIKSLSGDII